jgi:Domain of unknown function (DU1801)
MAETKTKPTAASVSAFIEKVGDEAKRADARALVKLMQTASGEKAKMWGSSIIGFGSHHYRYDSGREGDTPLVGFAPRKSALVLYGLIGSAAAQRLLAKLGEHTTGKGCLYIKKLAHVDKGVLAQLIALAVAARRGKETAK